MILQPLVIAEPSFSVLETLGAFTPSLLLFGWLFVLFLVLWLAWSAYRILKSIEYSNSIRWAFLQVTLPEEAEFTPKSMETAISVWAGIHKDPDLIERFFEGYIYAWYSLEIQCQANRVRYIMVVPHQHRQFFEGAVYGQYPTAEIHEVEDYTSRFKWQDIGQKFDLYGTEMILQTDSYYPLRTYVEYEDKLAPEERFIDPHQALIEAYTNINEGEEYWIQICVKPIAPKTIEQWAEEGAEEVARISGQLGEPAAGIFGRLKELIFGLPGEILHAATVGPVTADEAGEEERKLRFFNPIDSAKMEGILQKINREAFLCKIRLIYMAPAGQMNKPNISRAIGVFKQFTSFTMNGLKPDPDMKTNGPNYFLKYFRRRWRERRIFLLYQWRDHGSDTNGEMLGAEELATLYHFPGKWIMAPGVTRAKAGLKSAPENIPYV